MKNILNRVVLLVNSLIIKVAVNPTTVILMGSNLVGYTDPWLFGIVCLKKAKRIKRFIVRVKKPFSVSVKGGCV